MQLGLVKEIKSSKEKEVQCLAITKKMVLLPLLEDLTLIMNLKKLMKMKRAKDSKLMM
jgi:hypothetical protein